MSSALNHRKVSEPYLNMPAIPGVLRRLGGGYIHIGLNENVDMQSNGQKVKALLRCSSSGCFDMHNVCCKACTIGNCRYKCNFLDSEICEYQYMK